MIFEKQIIGAYRAMAYTRCDDTGVAYYFSAADFEGLLSEEYTFAASAGHKLVGAIYSYEGADPGRIIVFDHGFGGGHRSYMREIEMLCRRGYRVFAYDHTGCMRSGGETTNGMAQSLSDLNDAINAIKSDGRFAGVDISVMGHSWGGYSCLNIAALHPDVSHIVAISGFVSVELLVNSFFGGLLRGYRKRILAIEQGTNPDFVGYNATETLSKTSAEVLLIYSKDDKLCRKNPHYDVLAAALSEKPNVKLLLVDNKGHNPNYTEDAVKYLAEYSALRGRLLKKGKLSAPEAREAFVASFDWRRMTEQDEAVWSEIFAALERRGGAEKI